MENKIEIYKTPDNQTEIRVQFEDDTIWLTQLQMAELFNKDVRTINEHVKNIYKTEELNADSTIRNFRIVRTEGKRKVQRNIDHYNLDIIISVGYRVNSKRGTQFRQWATKRLKDYLVQGYAINEKRLAQKNQEIKVLKDGISILTRTVAKHIENTENGNEWLSIFSKGLKLLDDYDHETLDSKGKTIKEAVYPDYAEYMNMINEMHSAFKSDVFAKPKDSSFNSSINQIRQSFGGVDCYPSIEEKAVNLLYFVVKNHSFVDGNKRIAAACFLLFLEKNNILQNGSNTIISNEALASLTLYIAISKPEEASTVKKLIISILNRGNK
ncbi:MAG: virulence protein RhuM/Fic/DOC family protein [Desulfobacteraceae bacterium]|nr:virulence protein RhuM/Fic/DOC family protein [Desulfobacteraceae bacterium]